MQHYNHCKNCWKQEPCDCTLDEEHLCADCTEREVLERVRIAKCEKDLFISGKKLQQVWKEHISVWPFRDAPKELQAFSNNGGDEDWAVIIPPKINKEYGDYIAWLEGTSFDAAGHPQIYVLSNGYKVVIGSHS